MTNFIDELAQHSDYEICVAMSLQNLWCFYPKRIFKSLGGERNVTV